MTTHSGCQLSMSMTAPPLWKIGRTFSCRPISTKVSDRLLHYMGEASLIPHVITDVNTHLSNESMLAYSQATGNARLAAQASNNYQGARNANFGRRLSAPAAPHPNLQNSLATQHFRPSNLVGESQDPVLTQLATRLALTRSGHGFRFFDCVAES